MFPDSSKLQKEKTKEGLSNFNKIPQPALLGAEMNMVFYLRAGLRGFVPIPTFFKGTVSLALTEVKV
jgi:hypothetical protein